ncbi:MAG: S8 family serine peptidase [Phycisphaeraceae bacterium]|nr:S8 family serine peptidase [Phycisphaeraceae bacterium]
MTRKRQRQHRLWNVAAIVVGAVAGLAVVTQLHPARTLAGDATPVSTAKAPAPTPREIIGLTTLESHLGELTPTGSGVIVGHVEGSPGDYMPNGNDKIFKNVELIGVSGPSKSNDHSNATSSLIFGPGGMAPGVTQGYFFDSNHWLTSGFLHGGTSEPPTRSPIRVFTHSWIGGQGNGSLEVLHRLDYAIDQQNVIMVVGVNNKRTPVPVLLASAYNVIAVGNSDSNSSGGYTKFDGDGRCKPDLVGPMNLTSYSTPIVAACVARLLEAIDRLGPDNPAHHSEVVKALLMAGAERTAGWKQEPGKPLDSFLGAGIVRIDRAYDILMAGQAKPEVAKNRYGWAFEPLKLGETHGYRFEASENLAETSLMLVWNRRIDGRRVPDLMTGITRWNHSPRLADFDLRLVAIDDEGREKVLNESASSIDNVELIYRKNLPRGRYRIEVTRKDKLDEEWDYALAWRIEK